MSSESQQIKELTAEIEEYKAAIDRAHKLIEELRGKLGQIKSRMQNRKHGLEAPSGHADNGRARAE